MLRNTGSCLENVLGLHHLGVVSSLGHESIVTHKVLVGTVLAVNITLVASVRSHKGSQRHLVLGEGSSLIRADNSYTSKGLHGRKGTDNGILLGHVADGPGIGHSHNGLKTFRDHSNSTNKSNGNGLEHLNVVKLEESNKESNDGGDNNEESQPLGHSVNLFQNGSLLVLDLVHKSIDGSNLGEITGGSNNTSSRTLGNKSGTVAHVLSVSKRNLLRIAFSLDNVDTLVDGDGFTSKGGFGASKVVCLNHTQIGRNTVSETEDNDITGDNQVGGDLGFSSVTDDDGITGKHSLQGLSSLFGGTFLNNSNGGVDTEEFTNLVSYFDSFVK